MHRDLSHPLPLAHSEGSALHTRVTPAAAQQPVLPWEALSLGMQEKWDGWKSSGHRKGSQEKAVEREKATVLWRR